MVGVFDLELHDTSEGEEDISDDDYFEPDEPVCIVSLILKQSDDTLTFMTIRWLHSHHYQDNNCLFIDKHEGSIGWNGTIWRYKMNGASFYHRIPQNTIELAQNT